jgi:oxygen-independent coproporphyrinogen-3 oxidase
MSCYELSVEEGTPLASRAPSLPSEETVASQWEAAMEGAARAGLVHYEVANYARPGRECRHNLKYWRDSDFIGVGAGAWSSVSGVRTANPSDVGAYHDVSDSGFKPAVSDVPDEGTRMAETLVLNLRLMDGCVEREFEARYGSGALGAFAPVLDAHIGEGRLAREGGRLRLTGRGLMVANEIWADIYGVFSDGCGYRRADAIFC